VTRGGVLGEGKAKGGQILGLGHWLETISSPPARFGRNFIARRAILTVFSVTLIASRVWEPSCVVSGHERGWGRCTRPPTSGATEMPWCGDSGKGDVARWCQNLRWQLSPQVREWGDEQTANKNL
jgi:hypothetical protein